MKDRQVIVDRFKQNPQNFIFLISTKAGVQSHTTPSSSLRSPSSLFLQSLGLNLTAANIVVVFDPNWHGSHSTR